jgi:hypothetical protein
VATERAIVVFVILRRRRLLRLVIVVRATGLVMFNSTTDAAVLVRMTQSANDRVKRLQGDGEEGDKQMAAAHG